MKSLAALTVASALALGGSAFGSFSTFDSGTDGWSVIYNGSPATWEGTGGPSGAGDGFLRATDDIAGAMMFMAPGSFLGDHSATYGDTFSYDYITTSNASGSFMSDWFADIRIAGAGMVLEFNLDDPLVDTWTSYAVPLVETAGWRLSTDGGNGWFYDDGAPAPTAAEFMAVLADVTSVTIGTEIIDDVGDTIGIDNVFFSQPVPAPGALALLGLAGFVGTRRRRA